MRIAQHSARISKQGVDGLLRCWCTRTDQHQGSQVFATKHLRTITEFSKHCGVQKALQRLLWTNHISPNEAMDIKKVGLWRDTTRRLSVKQQQHFELWLMKGSRIPASNMVVVVVVASMPQKRVYVGYQKEHSKKCTMNIKLDWNGKKPAGISYWKKTLKSLRRKTEIFGRCSLFTVQTMVKLSGIKEVFTHWGSKKRRNLMQNLMQNLSLTSIYEERGAYDSWCNRAGVRALGVSINLDAISS